MDWCSVCSNEDAVAVCYGRRWHQFTGCFMPPTHAWPQAVDSSQKELLGYFLKRVKTLVI